MRAVVIGASGNVGTSVLRALGDAPEVEQILGIARRRPSLNFPRTTWLAADIARDDLRSHLSGADVVILLAWLIQPSHDERAMHAVNVQGSTRVLEAVARAGVPALVYGSSVGAYAPGPKDRAVDESWPTTGIASSYYSRHKAALERILDSFESAHPEIRVARLRPGLIFKREAASEIRRLFAGPLLPRSLLRRSNVPVVPSHSRLRFQAVHADDVGRAYSLAALGGIRGAVNIAAEPVLDGAELGRLLNARPVPVPAAALRGAAHLTWRAHLQPSSEGWVDMALGVPLMSTGRARTELGWTPRRSSGEAFLELFDGMREGAGLNTPPLDVRAGGRARLRELLTGVGSRAR